MDKDYKKLYEEALERAKDLHDNHPLGQPQTWMTCEKIFPELKESEDERIRKEIISFITDRKNWFPKEETKSSWIAWLEKQGEQKLYWNKKDEEILDGIIDTLDGLCLIDSDRLNCLKSLKPNHWKPNKEQMMTLCALCVLHKESKVLESLYNDLKSL